MVVRGRKQMAAKKAMAKISDSQSLAVTLSCYKSFIPLRGTYRVLEAQKGGYGYLEIALDYQAKYHVIHHSFPQIVMDPSHTKTSITMRLLVLHPILLGGLQETQSPNEKVEEGKEPEIESQGADVEEEGGGAVAEIRESLTHFILVALLKIVQACIDLVAWYQIEGCYLYQNAIEELGIDGKVDVDKGHVDDQLENVHETPQHLERCGPISENIQYFSFTLTSQRS